MFKNKTILFIGVVIVAAIVGALILAQTQGSPTSASAAISPADYQTQFAEAGASHLLVDVRTPEEFVSGHIHGAVNISLDTLPDRLNEIPRDIPIVVYCRSGNRSNQAAHLLADAGYTNIRDLGGVIAWTEQGYPLE